MWDVTKEGHPSQRMVIDAHEHNIPCVKFSPCGNKATKIKLIFEKVNLLLRRVLTPKFLKYQHIPLKIFRLKYFL